MKSAELIEITFCYDDEKSFTGTFHKTRSVSDMLQFVEKKLKTLDLFKPDFWLTYKGEILKEEEGFDKYGIQEGS